LLQGAVLWDNNAARGKRVVQAASVKSTGRLLAVLLLAWVFPTGPGAASEYRIAVGDVLELSASSVPEFRHRATVGVDGEVSFPLVGEIQAAQRSLAELRKVVKDVVPRKTVRRRALDGSEHEVVIDAEEITLVVAEYSPVYVSGDVAKPGSYTYRPGLTVGQAISLAGGYDVIRSRIDNPYWLAPEVRAQQDELTTELARDQARVARIQAELGGSNKLGIVTAESPLASNIQALEADQLSARLVDVEKERGHLTDILRSLSTRLELLQKQNQTERDRSKIDQDELDRVQTLFEKGMVPITRLTDVKRLVLLSASRATDIESRAEETRTQIEMTERRLQRLDDERRIVLLKELQDAHVKLAGTQARLAASNERMFYLGALRSQIGRGNAGRADFVIVRRGGTRVERIAARQDTELLPNDLVEIALDLSGVGSWDGSAPVATGTVPGATSPKPAPDAVAASGPSGEARRNAGNDGGRDVLEPRSSLGAQSSEVSVPHVPPGPERRAPAVAARHKDLRGPVPNSSLLTPDARPGLDRRSPTAPARPTPGTRQGVVSEPRPPG
jgi:polysaccharide biosynthesis/export protein